MIAACPSCNARYRIDSGRLRPEGVRLRCSRCEAVFRVRPPAAEGDSAPHEPEPAAPSVEPAVASPPPAPVAAPPQPTPATAPVAAAAESAAPTAPAARAPAPVVAPAFPSSTPPTAAPDPNRDRLVLIADPEIEQGKRTVGALVEWGLQPILVHDGVEAILTIQRALPRAIVIDAALPKMFGFQVCELVKRNESLRHIHVALVGAIHDPDRYRRAPSELYGADAYVERPQLPDALHAILAGFGLELGPITSASPEPPAVQPAPAAPATPAPMPEAAPEPAPSAQAPSATGEREAVRAAERLARIIVSDIILYNEDKFAAALQQGNVAEAMTAELAEGRSLFVGRIDARVRDQRDFLVEELLRVARERGMT